MQLDTDARAKVDVLSQALPPGSLMSEMVAVMDEELFSSGIAFFQPLFRAVENGRNAQHTDDCKHFLGTVLVICFPISVSSPKFTFQKQYRICEVRSLDLGNLRKRVHTHARIVDLELRESAIFVATMTFRTPASARSKILACSSQVTSISSCPVMKTKMSPAGCETPHTEIASTGYPQGTTSRTFPRSSSHS
ncbi:hypothetical protein KC323_g19 [Hortaea werneckii]|nr:hypothetical protein KC323_g19 [Hortaea werneckii]